MTDWATIASLATAAGTLVLAIATFGATRSANRAARASERALLAGLRPVLIGSRLQDDPQKIMWADRHWAELEGGFGYAAHEGDVIYLAISVRNVGNGIAVVRGWYPLVGLQGAGGVHESLDRFRRQSRDLYVAPNDTSFWQGAVRDTEDPMYGPLAEQIEAHEAVTIDVLYANHEEGQETVSRFALVPDDDGRRIVSVARHWLIERDG
jgi:hypothetical protein